MFKDNNKIHAILAAGFKPKDLFSGISKAMFNIDAFKQVYCNEDTITKAIPYFWKTFDNENYSIWFCEYKYPEDLTQIFMTCNLLSGMLQRLDTLRKNAFASMCIFGENNNNTIAGVWIWPGHRLVFELSRDWQIDYESYTCYYRQKLVKHIIAQCTLAQTADQISITVLDAIKWIDLSWENVTENTIRNGFRAAGFIHSSSTSSSSMMNMDNIIETDIESNNSDNPLQQLELLLISSY
ncbi:unnamed protein product [Rotaria magnacalcarata]